MSRFTARFLDPVRASIPSECANGMTISYSKLLYIKVMVFPAGIRLNSFGGAFTVIRTVRREPMDTFRDFFFRFNSGMFEIQDGVPGRN